MTDTPERKARRIIDANLEAAGWLVRSHDDLDLTVGYGIAVREFPMKPGFGTADYVLYVDRMAIGAIEAKPGGTLTGVEDQSEKYTPASPRSPGQFEKTNEIGTVIPLLRTLPDIAGQTLTVDALLTQRKLARHLLERGAHDVFTAKGNQKRLLEDIALARASSATALGMKI